MFHIATATGVSNFPALVTLVQGAGGNSFIAAQSKPAQITTAQWAKLVGTFEFVNNVKQLRYGGSGTQLAVSDIIPALDSGTPWVVIDELIAESNAIDSRWMISNCIHHLSLSRPDLLPRVGVFFASNNDYATELNNVNFLPNGHPAPAIEWIVGNGVACLLEMYISKTAYCAPQNGDTWLKNYFHGRNGLKNRTDYLVGRRTALGSNSRIQPIFGTSNQFLSGTNANRLMDHLLHVWKTEFGSVRAGSYVWNLKGTTIDYQTAPNGRDVIWKDSWLHYQGSNTQRLAPPFC